MIAECSESSGPVMAVLVSQLPPHYHQRGGGYIPIG